jgi:hypothetical protein
MATRRILISESYPEALALLERAVRHLGYQPVRLRRGMSAEPPAADALVALRSCELGRELLGSIRRRNPGLRIVYLDKPFSLERLRHGLERAVAPRRGAEVLVSLTRR